MMQTVEAGINVDGTVTLLESLKVKVKFIEKDCPLTHIYENSLRLTALSNDLL